MKKRLYLVLFAFFASFSGVYGQVSPCNCTANVSGTQNFSALTWTGTGCPTAGSTYYLGNLCVNIPNNANLIMNKNFTVDGGFGISTSGSNPTFTISAGFTMNVLGNMGDDNNNNTNFVINGNLVVEGTLYGKNSNGFTGSGNVTAGGLDFNQAPSCNPATTCTINWTVPPGACQPASSTFCTTTVLPVTLLFFEAKAYPEFVELKWATATELNFDRFVIEKTRDGKSFMEIGSVQGAGFSTERIDYSFIDDNVLLGRTYYRLKAIDFDGFTEYFGLVSVSYEGVDEISIFPNPAQSGEVNIYFNYYSEEPVYFRIVNVTGLEVLSGTIKRTGFDSQYTLKQYLSTGMYFLMARHDSSDGNIIVRFVIQ